MAKQNLTYVEARELVPTILSSNKYELLANADEYPTIPESFAKMTAGNYVHKQNSNRNKTTRSNGVQNQEYQGHSHTIVKRKKTEHSTTNSRNMEASSLHNLRNRIEQSLRYHECRKMSIDKKAKEYAQEAAYRNVQGELMTFYTALLQIPDVTEETKERIKECSKKYLHFDQVIN
ncbi:uncharacterized protein LOC135714313 [Ochlerotatus camptorhynchus]|uniref:uncharacterized protein LOC135714313 n=1 Tax=Ochlerotatus camptorhynchus TaxID=644619 RepID=UPI0031E169FB